MSDEVVKQVTDPAEALRLLAIANMRPFSKEDWFGFAGCETKDPMIGVVEEFVIVLDGATLCIVHGEDSFGGTGFQLKGCLKMKQIYKVTLYGGYVGLIEADSIEQANKDARCDQGRANVQRVELASEEDVQWVTAIGGPVPKRKRQLPSDWAREGFFVVEADSIRVGANIDYYDRTGCKRQGTVKAYDGKTIVIDGERKTIVTETFNVRFER